MGLKVLLALLQKKPIQHYERTLGACTLGGHRMIIPTQSAQILTDKYFK
jgi:hypothetical protein